MNDIQKVFSSFDPSSAPVSGRMIGLLRTAERISSNTNIALEMVSGILNDPEHASYITVIPRVNHSPLYRLNYGKFIIANMLTPP